MVTLSDAPHGGRDWRRSPRLPRRGYFSRRAEIRHIIVHHTADFVNGIEAVNRYHQTKNWGDEETVIHAPHICYHWFISSDGTVTRCNEDWEESWHAFDANRVGLAVSLQGNFNQRAPTTAQLDALRWLLDALLVDHALQKSNIYGHTEAKAFDRRNDTSCPGAHLLVWLRGYRTEQAIDWLGGFAVAAGAGNQPVEGAGVDDLSVQYQPGTQADMLYVVKSGKVFREVR